MDGWTVGIKEGPMVSQLISTQGDHNIIITSLLAYVLNIPIRGIFKKDLKFSKKESTIWAYSYD